MEGNKDEALKCCHLAEKLLNTGHREKAVKFLNKSIRLFPTKRAEELLKEISQNGASSNGSTPQDGGASTRRRRKSNSKESEQASSDSSAEKDYTPEQAAEVKKILGCKDYYEVLSIGRDFSENEIKKAYRKLALQFHPDKNKAPGAADAFKRIGHAFGVLNDEDKRKQYDQYGEDMAPQRTERHRYRQREFEGDISPEDLFNMFFGGGFPNGNVYVHRTRNHHHQQQHHDGQQTTSMYPLIQILPILMIILFSFLTSFLVPEPIYSFQQTSQYRYPLNTRRWNVQYFVKDTSIKDKYSPDEFADIERKIEREFIETLQLRCYRERQYKAELLQQARLWGNMEMKRRAERYHAESCQQLEGFQR